MRRIPRRHSLTVLAAGALLLWAPAAGASQRSGARSPGGAQVAFERGGEIWVSRSDGTHPRQVTAGDGEAAEPAFFPDGRSLVFSRRPDPARAQLYTVSVQGGVERPVPGAGAWAVSPTVSGSGLIAYLGGRGPEEPLRLRTVRVAGGVRHELFRPRPGTVLRGPRFSAGGGRILFRVCREPRRPRHCATRTVRSG